MVKKATKIPKRRFVVEDYKYRLRLLREVYTGDSQPEFAKLIDIPFKRWNMYERGYPIARETAFRLIEKLEGVSVEWLWFGMEGNMSQDLLRRIDQIRNLHQEQRTISLTVESARAKLAKLDEVRAKIRKAVPTH
jgi:hypothetical protein